MFIGHRLESQTIKTFLRASQIIYVLGSIWDNFVLHKFDTNWTRSDDRQVDLFTFALFDASLRDRGLLPANKEGIEPMVPNG